VGYLFRPRTAFSGAVGPDILDLLAPAILDNLQWLRSEPPVIDGVRGDRAIGLGGSLLGTFHTQRMGSNCYIWEAPVV
jgi:hypothetical protein